MLHILEIVLPVFLVTGAGYVAVRSSAFTETQANALMRFAQGFAIPCFLFAGIARIDLGTAFQPELLVSYYGASTTVFLLGIFGARAIFRRRPGESVAIGFSTLFANSVLLGLPIVGQAYGEPSLVPALAIVALHAPFCYLLGIATMEFARSDSRVFGATVRAIVRAMFSNSLTIAIALGFVVNVAGVTLPNFLQTSLDLMVSAALPVALFALGGILVRYRLKQNAGETALICGLKLVVHPCLAYFLSTAVFDLSEDFTRAAVVTAAMAPGVNGYIFADMYGRARNTAASAVLAGTAASILSVSIWLAVL